MCNWKKACKTAIEVDAVELLHEFHYVHTCVQESEAIGELARINSAVPAARGRNGVLTVILPITSNAKHCSQYPMFA